MQFAIRHINRGQRQRCYTAHHIPTKVNPGHNKRLRTRERQKQRVAKLHQEAFEGRQMVRELQATA